MAYFWYSFTCSVGFPISLLLAPGGPPAPLHVGPYQCGGAGCRSDPGGSTRGAQSSKTQRVVKTSLYDPGRGLRATLCLLGSTTLGGKNSTVGGLSIKMGFPGDSDDKVSAYNAGDLGLIPGVGRSPREGNGNPLHYSCLENPMDRGAW